MAIFRRLIQTPASPEKSLKALTGAAKYKAATFARLADVNDLARSVDDTISYSVDAATTAAATVAITTKKGIIKVTNASTSSTTLTLTLSNSEFLLTDVDKYFVQVTIASATTFSPSIRIVPIASNGSMQVVISVPSAINWATNPTYAMFNIVRTGD